MTKMKNKISVAIATYPGCMQSAVQGLKEMFVIANDICERGKLQQRFSVELYDVENASLKPKKNLKSSSTIYQVIIIPPDIEGNYYLCPNQAFISWLKQQHASGCLITSICAGTFILAATGLLKQREATTHWRLSEEFRELYPEILLDINKILINDGDIITAGGLMSWVDLGLELVAQFTNASIMRQLGKLLVVDTGLREQRYYKSFSPKLDHGDNEILGIQHFIQANFSRHITVSDLAARCSLSERTFLRHFVNATGFKPVQYLQKVRIQKACELLETTKQTVDSVDSVAYKVGYEDTSAFRKIFIKTVGLTPVEFKRRFFSN